MSSGCSIENHRARQRERGVSGRECGLKQLAGSACRGREGQPIFVGAVRVMPTDRRDPRVPTTRDVAARGARIRFVEAGNGPPLVLVHDYLASRASWDDVLPRLSTRFRVIAPDLPGFGESEKPPPSRYRYDFEAFCESLADLVAALGLGRVSLCGHAMG